MSSGYGALLELRPRLKEGWRLISRSCEASHDSYLVSTGNGSTILRLGSGFYRMLCAMDGDTRLRDIIADVCPDSPPPTPAGLRAFLRSIARHGLATFPDDEWQAVSGSPDGRFGRCRSFLSRFSRRGEDIPLVTLTVDRLLARISNIGGRLLLSRAALVWSLLTLVTGTALFFAQSDLLLACLGSVAAGMPSAGETILFLGPGLLLATVLHEFGHALTAKQFGCAVPVIGVRLRRCMPVVFTQITGCWSLPARQRILVSLAGPLANLLTGGALSIGARLAPDLGLTVILFSWSAVNYSVGVVNLIPFARLDGYHILSDAFNRPHLWEEAQGALFRPDLWSGLLGIGRGGRTARLLLLFGALSVLFPAFVTAVVAAGIGMTVLRVAPEPLGAPLAASAALIVIFAAYVLARSRLRRPRAVAPSGLAACAQAELHASLSGNGPEGDHHTGKEDVTDR